MNTRSSHELLIGLHVTDDARYTRYREGMTPILHQYGGSFRYDFRIAEVLKAETNDPINRLFILSFPNARAKDAFFADEEYQKVKREFFEGAVQAVQALAEYVRKLES